MEIYNDQTRPLEPEMYYHIYNRGNQGALIFYREENYRYFLSQYEKYISRYADTFAYCLPPNHFHLIIRIRPSDEIDKNAIVDFPDRKDLENHLPHMIVSERFRRFFLSYAKAINKQEGLSGSIFKKYFHRKKVDNDTCFTRLIHYIHTNSRRHGIQNDWVAYHLNSYRFFNLKPPIRLNIGEVVDWFGGKDQYLYYHQQNSDDEQIQTIIIEE